jgi:hypothetical protein
VQQRAKALGELISEGLAADAAPMTEPVLDALDQVAAHFSALRPTLRDIFSDAAGYVPILTRAVATSATSLVEDLAAIVDNAEPVVEVFAEHLPKATAVVGDALRSMSEDSENAAAALDATLTLVEGTIKTTGTTVGILNDLLPVTSWSFIAAARAIDDTGEAANNTVNPLGEVRSALGATADEIDALVRATNEWFAAMMGVDEATIAAKDGMVSLKEELVDGKRTLDISTAAGRENASAVLDQVDRINRLREARVRHGMSLDEANAKYAKDIEGLRRTMLHLGFTRAEVDRLIGKYRQVPNKIETRVSADVRDATGKLSGFLKKINTIDGRTVTVYARFTPRGDLYIPGQGTSVKNRWGGVYEHAQDGLLRDAAVYGPQSPARYAFAEPSTRGEAFIPRAGNYERSMMILDRAASWYGARVTPGGSAGGGMVRVVFDFAGADTQIARALRGMVRVEGGGNVQVAFGS